MDPGDAPEEIRGLSPVEELLIPPIITVSRTGSWDIWGWGTLSTSRRRSSGSSKNCLGCPRMWTSSSSGGKMALPEFESFGATSMRFQSPH